MGRAGVASPRVAAAEMYRALGASIFELLWLAGRGGSIAAHTRFAPGAEDRWARARRGGRGLVVAASHTGNWELAAAAVAAHEARSGHDFLLVVKRLHVSGFDAFCRRARTASGITLSDGTGALARGHEALLRGDAVGMVIDQVPAPQRHEVRAEFLGGAALLDRAPATLAARAGVPMVVLAVRRDASGAQLLDVLEVLEPPPRASRRWIDAATRDATRALDRFVRAHPSEWLWMHRRWKGCDETAASPSNPSCGAEPTKEAERRSSLRDFRHGGA